MFDSLFGNDEEVEYFDSVDESTSTYIKMPAPSLPRLPFGFVGLMNQGATCYLNSLIQVMYMTPELRNGIFSIDPEELGVYMTEEFEKEKDENQRKGIIEADDKLLESLLSMGVQEHHARKALIATSNGSVDTVLDYIEQHENDEEFNQPISIELNKKKKKKPRYIPLELQRLFSMLKLVNIQAVSTQELTTRGFQWQGADGQIQHDAHELNRLLIDVLEKSLKRTSGDNLCQRLYEGKVINQIICKGCGRISEREESYYDLNMQVIDSPHLIHSLRQYCAGEILQGDSAYQCGYCPTKQTAVRASVLRSLPPVLTFSCSRFKIDKSTNWQRVKVTSRSEFPLILNMSPFIEGSPNINQEAFPDPSDEKQFIENLHSNKMVWIHDIYQKAITISKHLMTEYGDDVIFPSVETDACMDKIRRIMLSFDKEVDWQEETIRSNEFDSIPMTSSEVYMLHAVVMHRGSAHSGHYFAYIRDNLHEGDTKDMVYKSKHFQIPQDKVKHPMDVAHDNEVYKPAEDVVVEAEMEVEPLKDDAIPFGCLYYQDVWVPHGPLCCVGTQSGQILLDSTSPLTRLILLFVECNRSKSINATDGKTPNDFLTFKALGKLFSKSSPNQGSWAETFKPVYGPLNRFLSSYRILFELEEDPTPKSVRLKSNDYVIVDNEDYQRIYDLYDPITPCRLTVFIPSDSPPYPNIVYGKLSVAKRVSISNQTVQKTVSTPDPVTVTDEVVTDSVVEEFDEDEAMAKALQASLDEEFQKESQPINHQNKEEESWEPANKKKEKKKNNLNVSRVAGAAASDHRRPVGKKVIHQIDRKKLLDAVSDGNTDNGNKMDVSSEKDKPVDDLPIQSKTAASTFEDKLHEKIQVLSHKIVQYVFGTFFEFNDSMVTPMTLLDLEKAFEGPDSAYLLVYRSLQLNPIQTTSVSTSTAITPISTQINPKKELIHQLMPPLHWQLKIDEMNTKLLQDRAKYEVQSHSVRLHIRFPACLQYLPPSPLLAPTNDPTFLAIIQTIHSVPGPRSNDTKPNTDYIVLDIDCRKTIADIITILISKFGDYFLSLGIDSTHQMEQTPSSSSTNQNEDTVKIPSELPIAGLVLSKLNKYQDGFHVQSPMSLAHTIDQEVNSGAQLLLWDGKTIQNLPIPFGPEATPRRLKATKLDVMQLSSKLKPTNPTTKKASPMDKLAHNVVEVEGKDNIWVPYSMSLHELCVYLLCTFGIDPSRGVIHTVEDRSIGKSSNVTTRSTNQPVEPVKQLAVTVLYNKGIISGNAAKTAKKKPVKSESGDGNSNGVLIHDKTLIGEVDLMTEFLIEDIESRGFKSSSLAESYIERKNVEWTITIELEFDPTVNGTEGKLSEEKQIVQEESKDKVVDAASTVVKVDVQKTCTVAELKLMALEKFQLFPLEEFCNITRLRSGLDRGEGILVDEDLTLLESKLKDGQTIFLEKGSKPEPDAIVLNIILVQNNSPAFKYDGVDQGGVRMQEIELIVNLKDAVMSVRDQAGVLLLGYSKGWTSLTALSAPIQAVEDPQTSSNIRYHRLRRTNWLKDCGELLLELTESSELALIEQCGLKNGDTLLLEEGILPVRGQITFKIFGWIPEMKYEEGWLNETVPPATHPFMDKKDGVENKDEAVDVEKEVKKIGEMEHEPLSPLEIANRIRTKCLLSLPSLNIMEDQTLMDLQVAVFNLINEKMDWIASQMPSSWTAPTTMEHILIRELRPDLLPGKSFWMSELPTTSTTTASSSTTGNKNPNHPPGSNKSPRVVNSVHPPPPPQSTSTSAKKLSTQAMNTLKRLHLKGDKVIAVEFLSDSQYKVRPPAGTFRVWIQRLTNPGDGEGKALMDPLWPPKEMVIHGGSAPSLGHLKRPIAANLNIPIEKLVVYKFYPQFIQWLELSTSLKLPTNVKNPNNRLAVSSNNKPKKLSGKVENITAGPYFVKDGDVLCYFQSASDNSISTADIKVSRPEDIYAINIRATEKEMRKNRSNKDWDGCIAISKAIGYRPEIMLSLGTFDFSDGEDDANESSAS